MNKLTKEQAEWLIERFKEKHTKEFTYFVVNGFEAAIEIINQCAEKEFPGFTVDLHDYEKNIVGCIFLSDYIGADMRHVELRMRTPNKIDSWTTLFPCEFKQFTEGCQKIVEWLNEQS